MMMVMLTWRQISTSYWLCTQLILLRSLLSSGLNMKKATCPEYSKLCHKFKSSKKQQQGFGEFKESCKNKNPFHTHGLWEWNKSPELLYKGKVSWCLEHVKTAGSGVENGKQMRGKESYSALGPTPGKVENTENIATEVMKRMEIIS